ncbi:Colicin V production protein [Desulfovibrio sp. X2]|uniref:CvpA family protein n=1 Tax=Desulfovibrio sp. X2 TaxID=941449 RepID=UPI000358B517|nr:CvpA family protein [Desulfovibrio sp. X2]EPR37072.1 Colicin V production protein [Desulfovibrio sp. X2]
MNTLDIIFLIILGLFCLRGFMNGLVREAAALVGLGFAFYAANLHGDALVPLLTPHMGDGAAAHTASYLLVFVGTLFVVWIGLRLVSSLLKLQVLALADHALGGLLGFLKGGLLCAVIILVMATFLPNSAWLTGSRLAPQIAKVAVHMVRFLPEDMQRSLRDQQKKLEGMHFRMPDLPL